MVRDEVDEVPRARGAGAREQRAEGDDGGELQLGAADARRLVDAEQPCVVEIAQRLVGHAPQLLAARRALLQLRQQRFGPAPQLSVRFGTSQESALRSRVSRRGAAGCTRRASRGSRCGAARR